MYEHTFDIFLISNFISYPNTVDLLIRALELGSKTLIHLYQSDNKETFFIGRR